MTKIMLLNILGFGFLLGIKHALEADHITAVSTIAVNQNSMKKSCLLGAFWGFGHTISLFVAGLLILLLKITIPKKLVLSLEFIIGVMLILLGFKVFLTIKKEKIHFHKHRHGKKEHIHFHSHEPVKQHYHKHLPFKKSLFIGLIHGFAGSAALSLLVLTTIQSFWMGVIYIAIFGLGSIIGMMLVGAVISLPLKLIPSYLIKSHKFLKFSIGLISIMLGFIMTYNLVFYGVYYG